MHNEQPHATKKHTFGSTEWVEEVFTYHAPNPKQVECYAALRAKAKEMAEVILTCTPRCADQSAALRLLRECVMTSNAAVALEGLV